MGQANVQTYPILQVKTDDLVPGDIIATRSNTTLSRGIRTMTRGQVSHLILYTGLYKSLHWAVDSTGKGVILEPLSDKLMHTSYASVFRHKTATPEQCVLACRWAKLQAAFHKPYDYKSAARVGAPTYSGIGQLIILNDKLDAKLEPKGEDASFMCSELVFRAFEIAGAPLTNKPAHCISPSMIFSTNKLTSLGRLA